MPRRRPLTDPDATYHVTCRCPARRVMFRDDDDRRRYLDLVGREIREREWTVFTYCLMTTHVHWVLRSRALDFGAGFKEAHETYAVEFNRKWDEHGTLISNGPRYTLIKDESHFLATLRYVARNPIEAGLCDDAADWPWSAHRALIGAAAPDLLSTEALSELVPGRGSLWNRYAELTTLDDDTLLGEVRAQSPRDWIARAIDEHGLPVDAVARALGVTERTVYRRLAAQRAASEKPQARW